jgi:membrane protein required for beta-lactamase induction
MDFPGFLSGLTDAIVSFAQSNTIIAVIIALILLFLIYRKPKLFFGLLSLVFIVALLFYMIANLAGSGSERKKRLIDKEQTQSDSQ